MTIPRDNPPPAGGWEKIESAILAEREACAALVDEKARHYEGHLCHDIALEIRCRPLPSPPIPEPDAST
jgi:hypothetical protein